MGYLDNSTIVVDAVLTKHGRKLLAKGEGLNIKYFTLSDTGVDYTLWNPDHPSGSAYYGEAIENLPNLEALPSSTYFMRNNLLTMGRQEVNLPYVLLNDIGIGSSVHHTFPGSINATKSFFIDLSPDESTGWQCVVSDNSLITVNDPGWNPSSISGNAATYLSDVEIANAEVYESVATGNTTMEIQRNDTTTERSLTLTFISRSTGAYKHATLTLPAIN
jgi:hypothetical protein